jgi:hypothetical protein
MSGGGFKWEGEIALQKAIHEIDPGIKRAMIAAAEYNGPKVVSWAKSNAKWTDRTGNARNGLGGQTLVSDGGRHVQLVIFHSVPYGIWLEVRFSGRYAIIQPAIDEWFPKVMNTLGRLIAAELKR